MARTGIAGGYRPRFMIHRRYPSYQITSGGVDFDVTSGVVRLTLSSGLAENVPRDAFVQEIVGSGEQFVGTLPGALSGVHVIGASLTSGYLNPNAFLIGGNGVVSEDALQMLEFAWRMPDGELKAVTSGQSITTNYYNGLLSFSDGRYTPFGTSWEAWIASSDGYPACPARGSDFCGYHT